MVENSGFVPGPMPAAWQRKNQTTYTRDADKISVEGNTAHMSEVTRAELDAKLELIESRMDARLARIESSVVSWKDEAGELRKELSNAKFWAIGTAVAVLGIFLASMQWGLSSQKEENARFNSYMREDVKEISSAVQDISKTAQEIRIGMEQQKKAQSPE